MHTRPVIFVAAFALLAAATAAQAGENDAGAKAATSVAEMLQKRQQSQLRDKLAAEGRWDEVRKLDEAQVQRNQERQQQIVARMNEELSRNVKSDASGTNLLVDQCDKETLRLGAR